MPQKTIIDAFLVLSVKVSMFTLRSVQDAAAVHYSEHGMSCPLMQSFPPPLHQFLIPLKLLCIFFSGSFWPILSASYSSL